MTGAGRNKQYDWVAELFGALAPAAASGFAASILAPTYALLVALGVFVLAYLLMRLVTPGPCRYALAVFDPLEVPPPAVAACTGEGELVLQEIYNPPADELLLEDRLAAPASDSRVVQLFGPEKVPTAGQLKARIDEHLANSPRPPELRLVPDASDALFEALAELRRSLR